jgi:hypothetical protein
MVPAYAGTTKAVGSAGTDLSGSSGGGQGYPRVVGGNVTVLSSGAGGGGGGGIGGIGGIEGQTSGVCIGDRDIYLDGEFWPKGEPLPETAGPKRGFAIPRPAPLAADDPPDSEDVWNDLVPCAGCDRLRARVDALEAELDALRKPKWQHVCDDDCTSSRCPVKTNKP